MKSPDHAKICEEIYRWYGSPGVMKYGADHNLPDAYCEPCEEHTPIYENACLVCGTENQEDEFRNLIINTNKRGNYEKAEDQR